MSKEKEELLLCECGSPEHQIMFHWFEDEEGGEVYMTTHLCKLPFWKRLCGGLKYIFGHTSIYGDFDEIILRKKDACKLQRVINYLQGKGDWDD